MKKVLILLYFMLTWFVCQSQSFSFVVTPPSCNESNFVYFDSDGVLDYDFSGKKETYEVPFENIFWNENDIIIKGCSYDIVLVTDCKYIDQLLVVKDDSIVYKYTFAGTKIVTRD